MTARQLPIGPASGPAAIITAVHLGVMVAIALYLNFGGRV